MCWQHTQQLTDKSVYAVSLTVAHSPCSFSFSSSPLVKWIAALSACVVTYMCTHGPFSVSNLLDHLIAQAWPRMMQHLTSQITSYGSSMCTCSEGKLKSINGGGLGISSLVPRPPPLKTGKAWEHSSCEWTQGGRRREGVDIQICAYCKMIKMSSFNHAKVWSPMLDYSDRTGYPVHCFRSWAPPPTSTSRPI